MGNDLSNFLNVFNDVCALSTTYLRVDDVYIVNADHILVYTVVHKEETQKFMFAPDMTKIYYEKFTYAFKNGCGVHIQYDEKTLTIYSVFVDNDLPVPSSKVRHTQSGLSIPTDRTSLLS